MSFSYNTIDAVDLYKVLEGNIVVLRWLPIEQRRVGGNAGERDIGHGGDINTQNIDEFGQRFFIDLIDTVHYPVRSDGTIS